MLKHNKTARFSGELRAVFVVDLRIYPQIRGFMQLHKSDVLFFQHTDGKTQVVPVDRTEDEHESDVDHDGEG